MGLSATACEQLRGFNVATVWLFGSRATGAATPDSDTDIAILLREDAPPPGLLDRGRISDLLAGELGASDIDLTVLDTAPLELRAAVISSGTIVARCDEPRRVRFEVQTLSRWFDVRASVQAQDSAYLARVAEQGLR